MEITAPKTFGGIDHYTFTALLVSLVVYPVVYSSGVMGRLIAPMFTEPGRLHWWYFWLANLAFHWLPFALIWPALRKSGENWESSGLDWNWFARRKGWFVLLLVVLL